MSVLQEYEECTREVPGKYQGCTRGVPGVYLGCTGEAQGIHCRSTNEAQMKHSRSTTYAPGKYVHPEARPVNSIRHPPAHSLMPDQPEDPVPGKSVVDQEDDQEPPAPARISGRLQSPYAGTEHEELHGQPHHALDDDGRGS